MCGQALNAFDDAFRRARLAAVFAVGADAALDSSAKPFVFDSAAKRRDVVLSYTLLFCVTHFVVRLRALTLRPKPKRRARQSKRPLWRWHGPSCLWVSQR